MVLQKEFELYEFIQNLQLALYITRRLNYIVLFLSYLAVDTYWPASSEVDVFLTLRHNFRNQILFQIGNKWLKNIPIVENRVW